MNRKVVANLNQNIALLVFTIVMLVLLSASSYAWTDSQDVLANSSKQTNIPITIDVDEEFTADFTYANLVEDEPDLEVEISDGNGWQYFWTELEVADETGHFWDAELTDNILGEFIRYTVVGGSSPGTYDNCNFTFEFPEN